MILDDQLTPGRLLELAQAMRDLDPATMKTYQIEGVGKMINGQSVIEPKLTTDNMKAVLSVFQGKARLVDAPEQLLEVETTTTTVARSKSTTTSSPTGATTVPPSTSSTSSLPPVYVASDEIGILPTDDPACR